MVLWQVKENNEYVTMKTPSSFELDGEDLDSNSYRSVATGNLNRYIIGKKWQSAKFEFNYLTEAEAERICQVLNYYPMEVKFKSPMYSTDGMWEGLCYCSKWNISMQQNKSTGATWTNLSFTLVQSVRKSSQL